MSLSLGIDVGGVLDFISGDSQDAANASRAQQEHQYQQSYQQTNKFFDMQHGLARDQFNYQKEALTNLVKQAQDAGISPLAALGISGSSPVSLPPGS